MFLANENFPRPSLVLLRENGLFVKSIQEDFGGISDKEVVEIAQRESLVILTFDRDYGELVFRYGGGNLPAVVYFRNKEQHPLFAGKILLELLRQGIAFENAFTVVDKENIRQRLYASR